jgi:hypothetical protein
MSLTTSDDFMRDLANGFSLFCGLGTRPFGMTAECGMPTQQNQKDQPCPSRRLT